MSIPYVRSRIHKIELGDIRLLPTATLPDRLTDQA